MRKRVILATAALVSVLSFSAADAGGIPVFDAIADSQLVQDVKQGVQMLQQGMQMIREAQQTVQFAQMIYGAVSHITDIGQIMGILGMVGIQDPLPVNVYSLESLLRGTGGINGMAGNIGSLFNSNLGFNKIFSPGDIGLGATALNERLNAISGSQSIGDTLFVNAQTRMPLIRELM